MFNKAVRLVGKKWKKIPRHVITGVAAVLLMYIASAGIITVSMDLMYSSDTKQHNDYTWRLYNGEIPHRVDGLTYPAFVEAYNGIYKQQASSANPPLFYILQSPIIGGLLDSGHYKQAIAVGKAVNIFLGCLCIIVLAYAGWLFGGKQKSLLAVSVPAIGALTYRFVSLNNIFGGVDALLIFFATLSIILMYKLIKYGPKNKYVLSMAVVCSLGMLTKAPFIVFFLLATLVMVYSLFKKYKKSDYTPEKVVRPLLIIGAFMLFVALSSGWFYYLWNYTAYGSWFTAREPGYTGGRVVKSVTDVLTSEKFWGLWYRDYSKDIKISMFLSSFAIAGILMTKFSDIKKIFKGRDNVVLGILLLLVALGAFATQFEHAVGVGAVNFRYMLPALFPISLVLAYGLTRYKQLRGQLLVLFSFALGANSIYARADGDIANLLRDTTSNGFPSYLISILLFCFAMGTCLLIWSMFKLTKKDITAKVVAKYSN